MKTLLLALAATTALGSAALAQGYPARARSAPAPYPAPVTYGLSADEAREYEQDQLDRRQEMERESLRIRQKAERRVRGLDDD